MMKSCETVVLVDIIEDAVKFYTEKLGFDIVDLFIDSNELQNLSGVRLRKGKCFIKFRTPHTEELADFSFIKRCASRCVCVQAEMKKGLDKYFTRCQKKGVKIVSQPVDCTQMGMRIFSVKDPFGIKLVFAQPLEVAVKAKNEINLCGMTIKSAQVNDARTLDQIITHLKHFGVLRRSAKKFAKFKIKEISK